MQNMIRNPKGKDKLEDACLDERTVLKLRRQC